MIADRLWRHGNPDDTIRAVGVRHYQRHRLVGLAEPIGDGDFALLNAVQLPDGACFDHRLDASRGGGYQEPSGDHRVTTSRVRSAFAVLPPERTERFCIDLDRT